MSLRENLMARLRQGLSTKKQEPVTQQEEEKQNMLKELKEKYEEVAKIAASDPIKQAAVNFYGNNFDANERAIGITFINEKILPEIVPLVKQALNSILLEGKIDINELQESINNMVSEGYNISELQDEENLSEIFSYAVSSDGQTLEERAQAILFNGEPPFPYRETQEDKKDKSENGEGVEDYKSEDNDSSKDEKEIINKFSEKQAQALTKDLILRLIAGEVEYITTVCPAAGKQLAILEALTDKFDERAIIESGFPISYDIEKQLLNTSDKKGTLTSKSKKGRVYKEEMMLYILQSKLEMMLRSGKYDKDNQNDISTIHIKDKILKLYKNHRLRIFEAEEGYLRELRSKIFNETDPNSKFDSFRLQALKEEYENAKRRGEKRLDIWNKKIKPEIYTNHVLPTKRYITVPGISHHKFSLTSLEAQYRLREYQNTKSKIQSSKIPLNRLYASSITGWTKNGRIRVSKMTGTPLIEEELDEHSEDEYPIH